MANVTTWEFIVGFLIHTWWSGYFSFWNAGDERRYSKSGWRRNAKNNGDYDPKPVFWTWHGFVGHLLRFNRLQPPLSWWSAL
jgi:hypothetical protein